jgi:hypothetical protein
MKTPLRQVQSSASSPPLPTQSKTIARPAPQPVAIKPAFQGLSSELGGKRMPEAVQQKMEAAFGSDFSDVRIHEGVAAESIGAIAYTQGSHIHFAPGAYCPMQLRGHQLLGHELAHVVQQRSGRVPIPGGTLINTDSRLEAEADAMGAKAAAGELSPSAHGTATGGVSSQTAPIQLQRKFTDKDIDRAGPNKDKVAGGAINTVDLITYDRPIGKTMKTGFFKADKQAVKYDEMNEYWVDKDGMMIDVGDAALGTGVEPNDPRLANRAVATSRYADLLRNSSGKGTGSVIAATEFANHNGQEGSVSEKALGSALKTSAVNEVTEPAVLANLKGNNARSYMVDDATKKEIIRKGDPSKIVNPSNPNEFEDPNKFYYVSGLSAIEYYHKFDFSNPETQKGLSDLQIMDALTGQVDRHGGNIYIDKQTGKVTGIDNDAAFGKKVTDPRLLQNTAQNPVRGSYNRGLPSFVDAETAHMVKHLSSRSLKQALKGLLDEQEIKAAVSRLEKVKKHIKTLKKTGGIVGRKAKWGERKHIQQWGQDTYNTLLSQPRENSYLGHAQESYDREFARGSLYAEGAPVIKKNDALPAQPLVPVNQPQPVVAQPQPVIAQPQPIVNLPQPIINPPQVKVNPRPLPVVPPRKVASPPQNVPVNVNPPPIPPRHNLPVAPPPQDAPVNVNRPLPAVPPRKVVPPPQNMPVNVGLNGNANANPRPRKIVTGEELRIALEKDKLRFQQSTLTQELEEAAKRRFAERNLKKS